MLQGAKCRHCKELFSPTRKGNVYCSATCRKLAHKRKTRRTVVTSKSRKIGEKLRKLSNSTFGRYLVRELQRAGTVQVLSGHTHKTLHELVELRRRCTSYGGFDQGKPLSEFELCHVWPVAGDSKIGLLHPKNLVMGTKSFNRQHSNTAPVNELGLFINKDQLLEKWSLKADQSLIGTLKLARSFLGDEFDQWLKPHVIQYGQKSQLIKKLMSLGRSREQLEFQTFDQLKQICDEVDVPYFSMSKPPYDEWEVAIEEMERYGLKSAVYDALKIIENVESFLLTEAYEFLGSDSQYATYKKFVLEQAQLSLHGLPHELQWEGTPLTNWWKEVINFRGLAYEKTDYDDIL